MKGLPPTTEVLVAKYQIEVTEVKEGGGCGSIIAFIVIIFIIIAAMGK